LVLALRAALAPFAFDTCGGLAAARTVPAGRFPPERLHGHAAEREQIIGQLGPLHRDARLAVIAPRQGVPASQADDPAGLAAPRAEQERPLGRHLEPPGNVAEWQRQLVIVVGDDESLVLDDEPVAPALGQRATALGRLERLANAVAVERQ